MPKEKYRQLPGQNIVGPEKKLHGRLKKYTNARRLKGSSTGMKRNTMKKKRSCVRKSMLFKHGNGSDETCAHSIWRVNILIFFNKKILSIKYLLF